VKGMETSKADERMRDESAGWIRSKKGRPRVNGVMKR
jgi:hypothetical protein